MDFIGLWSKKAEIKVPCFVDWLGITSSKYYHWKTRYGKSCQEGSVNNTMKNKLKYTLTHEKNCP